LPHDAQPVIALNHRFALPNAALLSALSKKSFSIASCPILACNCLMVALASGAGVPLSNTLTALFSNWLFHCVIWLGWTSTLGQFGQCLVTTHRGKRYLGLEDRAVVSSGSLHRLCSFGAFPLSLSEQSITYRPVQFLGASSEIAA
jgi:hypothetical protein